MKVQGNYDFFIFWEAVARLRLGLKTVMFNEYKQVRDSLQKLIVGRNIERWRPKVKMLISSSNFRVKLRKRSLYYKSFE